MDPSHYSEKHSSKAFDIDMEKINGTNGPIHPVVSTAVGEAEDIHPTQGLERGLKSRHAQMIALGGTIGTGLFVGSGQALAMGGPLILLLSYIAISVFLYGVASGLTEIAAYLPVAGCSVGYYANRYVSPSLSFAMGWVYWYIFSITVPAEMTVCGLVIQYWNPPVSIGVWITVSGIVMVALNCLPVRCYGETEFWFASLKVITILGLIMLTVVLFFGGGPTCDPLS